MPPSIPIDDPRSSDATTGVLGVVHSRPRSALPAGACDCHTHIFGPAHGYPWAEGRDYTPGDAGVADLLALQRGLGLERVVIVHPSPYGTDNRRTLDALAELGPACARGVAVIDPGSDDAALQRLHDAGVRGARVVLESGGRRDPTVAGPLLIETAKRVAPLGWHLQTYTRLPVILALSDLLMSLPVPLVIDHFGRVDAAAGLSQPGFDTLLSLVASGNAYVKLSAPHRISKRPDLDDVAPIARALIAANPDHVLWGSDWPHTGGGRGQRNRNAIEPFTAIDDGAVLDRLANWAGDATTLTRILVDNPARLYGF